MTNNNAPAVVLSSDDKTAAALVATIRAAVNGNGKYAAYVTAHNVTRETVKDHAVALASLAYPSDAPVQKKDGKRTRFGNAVQAAGNGLRGALDKRETTPTDYLAQVLKSIDAAIDHEVTGEELAAAIKAHIPTLLP